MISEARLPVPGGTTHDVFVYFKSTAAARSIVAPLLIEAAARIAQAGPCRFACSSRVSSDRLVGSDASVAPTLAPSIDAAAGGSDTWLEHYECSDARQAHRVLQALATMAGDEPLLQHVEGGREGRHIECFARLKVADLACA